VGIERSRDRNVIINGAMQIAQRGTSTASITAAGYYTADRWSTTCTTIGTWTQSIENDAPTGSGFRNSLKMLCTTADASPTGLDEVRVNQFIEGQNVQQFLKGTASAKPFALSFWVKSNVTGTYIVELRDNTNTRQVSASYTISASATWEKKIIIFPADTTGAFSNDNNVGLRLIMFLGAGTDLTSGTLNTTWTTQVNANRAVGQTNLASATNNYWQVTGVQLEPGSVATPFEFEDYGTTLAKCQRYYFRFSGGNNETIAPHIGSVHTAAVALWAFAHPVAMRSAASSIEVLNLGVFDNQAGVTRSGGTWSLNQAPNSGCTRIIYTHGSSVFTVGQSVFVSTTSATNYFAVSAEL